MSIAAIAPAPAAETPAKSRWLARNFWGISDQVLLSASNLITMVLAARALSVDGFGAFTLAYSALLFANIFQSALICRPHNVLGATRQGDDYRRYTTATLLGQVLLAAFTALCGLGLAGVAWLKGWNAASMLLALVPAVVAWQIQEFVRRVLYTENRMQAAFWNDLVSYGGRAVATAILYRAASLTPETCFHAITVATAPAAVLGIWQIRGALCRKLEWRVLAENWRFGRWLAGAELLSWCSSLQMYMFLAAVVIGPAASGALKAAQIIFGPTRVLAFYLGAVLPIRFARSLADGGDAALRRNLQLAYAVVVPLLGGYCLLVAVAAGPLLGLVYGPQYAAESVVLTLFAVTAFLNYMEMVITAALTARHQTRDTFVGYIWAAVVALTIGWLLLSRLGVDGAMAAMILTGLIVNVMFWRAFIRGQRSAQADAAAVPEPDGRADERRAMIDTALQAIEARQIPYCILHGYTQAGELPGKDVDCLVGEGVLGRPLAAALDDGLRPGGARIVQWLVDGAHYVAISQGASGEPACVVPLHFSTDYELGHRVFYGGREILDSRRRWNGWWVPSAPIEFGCVLVNRVFKGEVRDEHALHLSDLYAQDTSGCDQQIARFFDDTQAAIIRTAAASGDWESVRGELGKLQASLRRRAARGQRCASAFRSVAELARKVLRHLRPSWGMHVVFLGPDGVGKSTVIDAAKKDLGPAFLGTTYGTFAPELLPRGPKASPHALPPRSLPASLLKAVWWLVCYTVGYWLGARVRKARGRLVINHRYLLDAIVDPKRYRYSGPIWLLRLIWHIVPKPDLVVILDAPAEVVQSRKREVPPEETRRQCEAYRKLVTLTSRARLVNADRPLAQVVAEVESLVLDFLEGRTRKRLRLEDRP